MLIEKFNEKEKIAQDQYSYYASKSHKFSILRLIPFSFLVIFIVLIFIESKIYLLLLIPIFLVSFIFLVIIHNKIDVKMSYFKNMLIVIEEYKLRINGGWENRLKSTGLEYQSDESFLDLDIFGKNSLYSYINICSSIGGRIKLHKSLQNKYFNDETLKERQETVEELSDDLDFAISFQSSVKSLTSDGRFIDKIIYTKEKNINIKTIFTFLLFGLALSFTTIVLFILSFFMQFEMILVLIPAMLSLAITIIFLFYYKEIFLNIRSTLLKCNNLYDFFVLFKNKDFKSSSLNLIQTNISNSLEGINKLSKLRGYDEIRTNFLLMAIFNLFLPVTILISFLYLKYIKKYNSKIAEAFESFEDFEMYISLSIIGHVREDAVMPERCNAVFLSFENIKHPLIVESKCVGNNFKTKNGVNIITGSNMSGKTSFMRMIGINIVLMNAGCHVLASKFIAPYFKLFTSMRITDDIKLGISTFYAELLRIKKAIEYQKTNQNMLVLIDEVFRGTNSNDRIQGAISLLKKLNTKNTVVIMTTHDFELCNIDIENLVNYHFSEYYEDEKIFFPYKILHGKCKTTNARYLMKLIGIND